MSKTDHAAAIRTLLATMPKVAAADGRGVELYEVAKLREHVDALAAQLAEAEARAARLKELIHAREEYEWILDDDGAPPTRYTPSQKQIERRLILAESACEQHGDLDAASGDLPDAESETQP